MNTWTIKNAIGVTVEPRFICNVATPEEAILRYCIAAQMPPPFGWTATLHLLGRVVTWVDRDVPLCVCHISEVIEELGTMVRVSTGALVPRSCVTLFGTCRCGKTPQRWLWVKGRPAVVCASCSMVALEQVLNEPPTTTERPAYCGSRRWGPARRG